MPALTHDPDPNEAYELMPTPAELRGPPTDWFMVTCNGIPVKFFPPESRHLAERFISDPDQRMGAAQATLEALKRLSGGTIHLPSRDKDRPDRDRLALRFERFKAAA
jgi:hypothetical protein